MQRGLKFVHLCSQHLLNVSYSTYFWCKCTSHEYHKRSYIGYFILHCYPLELNATVSDITPNGPESKKNTGSRCSSRVIITSVSTKKLGICKKWASTTIVKEIIPQDWINVIFPHWQFSLTKSFFYHNHNC